MLKLTIETAEVFEPLLHPARYKGAHGGRGSGKSQFFGGLAVEDALRFPGDYGEGIRIVCVREVQKSLKESSKRLIESKLEEHGLGEKDGFKVFKDVIETPKGGLIIFQGMQDHTAESIKSLEGFDRAAIEEAQTLSETSLQMLRPTIRKEYADGTASEIWASWNPRLKRDPIDVLLRQSPPTNSVVVEANWRDNPWFPSVLEQERQDSLRLEPDQYDHVWEGGYVTVAKGAYFAEHLATAKAENRIGNVAEDPLMAKYAIWDIGGTGAKADHTVIWIMQFIGKEIRVLDHYEAQGQPLATHIAWLRENGYGKAECILPHDGDTHDKVYDVSYQSALEAAQFSVEVVPNQGKGAAGMRVEAVRRAFPSIWFNEKTTEAGRQALGWYHEKKDEKRDIGLGPEHDWSSHSADAFGLGCVFAEGRSRPAGDLSRFNIPASQGWMSG